ncbi:MAG: hypothetical protein L3J49_13820 [Desulfobulbaceae bacterium]|nr:hypothetical protein [Desulfobulbaceae bacterium]
MNIYEDEQLEEKLNELTDQLGSLVLDLLLVGLKKLNNESEIFHEFEDARTSPGHRPVPF